ncbi:hypothetical protein [Aestuariivirga litoralis]|uniref:hypothetical protein n=1 Tax=Aestuariivirga litoralis TaxID=2650924 RepID=UPI0018C6133B|nr:hypothetical protein [Aestuariivirga litoralis]MBG1231422.1 hypothetical protein [Aestuariivirga litoralis]
MKWLAAGAIALALLTSQASAEIWTYCGELSSGGAMVPAETSISRDDAGNLSGNYSFASGEEIHPGTLSRGHLTGPGRWQFTWRDDYGTGRLDLRFNADASAFDGVWGTGRDKPQQPWNGKLGVACFAAPTS